MIQSDRCEKCGGSIFSAGALRGQCPRCLLEAGLDTAGASVQASNGTLFGPYQIVQPIGAGGMGYVYKARDTRLHRDVAIKVLQSFALDSGAWARFQRETRAASALNHPNICTVYDVGEAEGQPYLVMEFLEGVTLGAHIGETALEPNAAVAIAEQIADALEAAHAKGIIHRDVKPANVMVTDHGHVKVLDFGLAKRTADQPEAFASSPHEGLTLESLSKEGTVVGTPHYLAPEVLQGGPADARSDLWALGVVLYQMLSVRLPFTGTTADELNASILDKPTPPLPPNIPVRLRTIVDRCLRKHPEERYQNAGEVRGALKTVSSSDVTRRRWLQTAGVAAVVGAGTYTWRQQPSTAAPLIGRLQGVTPTRLTHQGGDELDGVISWDGKFIAFVSDVRGSFDIYTDERGAEMPLMFIEGGYSEGSRYRIRNMGFTQNGEIWSKEYPK